MQGISIRNMVIGTAGHIDHGKSTLVRRLTGIDPDRLPEEKARGLTIDLGFAPFTLKNGQTVGIIDVPGHERFIKNMVAGATGIDIVMLVVAADDGIMPQTREHLNIMTLLGLKRGIVVITKIDMVERDFVEIVTEEVRDMVRGTFLEGAATVPVSSHTGEGIDALVETINAMALEAAPRASEGLFRMPIQRIFSARGFGTVVTGVPVSGRLKIGDMVELLPLGKTGKVRSLQAYKSDVPEICAGHSSAINVADIDYSSVKRGDVAAQPGFFKPTRFIEASFTYLPDVPKPLKHLVPVRLHTGTAEVVGSIALLEREKLLPGEHGLVQFRLDEPIVAAEGDPLILRIPSPALTIGGGRVLGTSEGKARRFKEEILAELHEREQVMHEDAGFVEHVLKGFIREGVDLKRLSIESKRPEAQVRQVMASLKEQGRLVEISATKIMHRDAFQKACAQAVRMLSAFHQKNPARTGMDRPTLVRYSRLEESVFEVVLSDLVRNRREVVEESGRFRLAGFQVKLGATDSGLREDLESVFREARFQTPRRDELPQKFKHTQDRINRMVDLLIEMGTLVELKDEVVLHRESIEEAKRLVADWIRSKGSLDPASCRDLLGTTRKYIIPLLEHLDHLGVTVRKDNVRILKVAQS